MVQQYFVTKEIVEDLTDHGMGHSQLAIRGDIVEVIRMSTRSYFDVHVKNLRNGAEFDCFYKELALLL